MKIVRLSHFILFFLIAVLNACYRYHVVREIKEEPKSLLNGDRVALVGFYPFKYQTIYAGSHSITLVTDLDTKNPTSTYIANGKRLEDFPVKGIDPSVRNEQLKQLVDTYKSYVGFYGLSELRKLIQWMGEPGAESYALKKRDVDYYILAVHGPENDVKNYGNSFRFLVSVPFSVLTLGTIPVWETRDVESQFFIYDARMNLLAKKEYVHKYTVLSAWWGRKEEGRIDKEIPDSFRRSLFRQDIDDFVEFFQGTLPPIKK